MKAKIRITKVEKDIELEFEYDTVDELCEIYDYITQEPVVVNEQGGGLEGALDKIKKALEQTENNKILLEPNLPKYPNPLYDPLIRFGEDRAKFMAGDE